MKVSDRGVTLVETMVAVFVALVGVFSLGNVIFEATVFNKNQGSENTRATIYAQDKMEALLSLDFAACTQTSTSQPATCNTTGITGSGWTQGLLSGGAAAPLEVDCPPNGISLGYVDYLDSAGQRFTGSSCPDLSSDSVSYIRMWQVQDLPSSGPAMKQVTVAVYSLSAVTAVGAKPIAVLTSVLSNPN
jgi:hypothetical protein